MDNHRDNHQLNNKCSLQHVRPFPPALPLPCANMKLLRLAFGFLLNPASKLFEIYPMPTHSDLGIHQLEREAWCGCVSFWGSPAMADFLLVPFKTNQKGTLKKDTPVCPCPVCTGQHVEGKAESASMRPSSDGEPSRSRPVQFSHVEDLRLDHQQPKNAKTSGKASLQVRSLQKFMQEFSQPYCDAWHKQSHKRTPLRFLEGNKRTSPSTKLGDFATTLKSSCEPSAGGHVAFYPKLATILSCPKDLNIKGDHLLGPLLKIGPKRGSQKVSSGRFAL